MTSVKVPVLPGAKTVVIGKIYVKPGDKVSKDSELFTAETKKGVKTILAPEDGIVREVLIGEGQEAALNIEAIIIEGEAEQAEHTGGATAVRIPALPGVKLVKIGKILVKTGETVTKGQSILQIEGKKGTVSVKAPEDGSVSEVLVHEGDEVSAGIVCVNLSVCAADEAVESYAKGAVYEDINADVLIIGGGTGGYVSAIRAARAGKKVLLVEKNRMGGTCLNVGCIPTKTLIESAHRYEDAVNAGIFGIDIRGDIHPDMRRIIERKDSVVDRLVGGIEYLMDKNHVDVINGTASFENDGSVLVNGEKMFRIAFTDCIIATGSSVMRPDIEGIDGKRIMDSTTALNNTELMKSVTIVGGGVIGLEFAFLYRSLGVEVTIIEFLDRLCAVMDADVSEEILRIAREKGIRIELSSRVTSFKETVNDAVVTFCESDGESLAVTSDYVLVAIGRKSYTEGLGLENTSIVMNPGNRGIEVDEFMRTNVEHIYAVGDVNNRVQLAHAASYEGMIAVDYILGEKRKFDSDIIPSVIFTMPEMASVGLNKEAADKRGIRYHEGVFHYSANGKALSMNETEGFIRILADEDETIIGAVIIGADASTIIASLGICVANRMKVKDLEKTVFAHPTTAEVIHEAALDLTGGAYHE